MNEEKIILAFVFIIMACFTFFAVKDLYIIYCLPSISFYDLIKIVTDLNLLFGFIVSIYYEIKEFSYREEKEKAVGMFCFGLLLSIFTFILDIFKSQSYSYYFMLIILYIIFCFLILYLFKESGYI